MGNIFYYNFFECMVKDILCLSLDFRLFLGELNI